MHRPGRGGIGAGGSMTSFGRGEVYALLCALCWSLAVIAFRRCGREVRPFSLNLFKNGLAAVIFVPVVLVAHGTAWPAFTLSEWALLAISAVIGISLADTLFFHGLNLLGAGRMAVVDCLYIPFVVGLSLVFLGERLHGGQGLGAALVVAGVVLAEFQPGEVAADRRRTWRGVAAGASGLFLMAVAIVMINPIIKEHHVLHVVEVRLVMGALAALPLLPLVEPRLPTGHWFQRGMPWRWMVGGTLLGVVLAMGFWVAGFKYTEASVAAVLNQTHVFFVMLFAALLLRERLTPRKLMGAALGFAGVAVMALV
jgi:drug/metabolite transporter (DMT)-like permease